MNPNRDPDRLINAFLMEGATELADGVYVAVRDRIEHTRQRAVIGSWREPDVNRYLKFALAAAAVLAIAVVGYRQFGSVNEVGPAASGSPAPSSTPAATATPAATPAGPALTETFTSDAYGITMSYPTGWTARPSTEAWTTSVPDYLSNAGDVVYDPTLGEGQLWISVASQPLGESTPDAWMAETIALDDGCTATKPITIDGASGLVGADGCTRAAVTTDGRGYFFWLYTSGDAASLSVYDPAWFEEVLATVQLQPQGPALTETFTSERYSFTMSYPSGWVPRPATEPWTTGVPDFAQNTGDVISDPVRESDLWIVGASQTIGEATPDEWAAERLTVDGLGLDESCTATEPITVDGAAGLIGVDGCNGAAVTIDGRGYFFFLYTSGDDPSIAATYDRAWFEDFLATVQLEP
jgi:hypothetical protein